MLITDQVATAPCTDRVQEWFRTFEASLTRLKPGVNDRDFLCKAILTFETRRRVKK